MTRLESTAIAGESFLASYFGIICVSVQGMFFSEKNAAIRDHQAEKDRLDIYFCFTAAS